MSIENSFHFNNENTFCITMSSCEERQNKMHRRFNHFQMEVSMWNASGPDDVVDKCADYLSPGQRGCAQSHMNVWRHIVNQKLPYALVLEDDACFDKMWHYKLNEFIETHCSPFGFHNPWDMLLLNCSEPIEPIGIWMTVTEQYLTGAYLISLNGARKLVDMFGTGLFAADWMTTRLQLRGRCYAFFPWLVIQEGLDTTIGSGVDADHNKVMQCLSDYGYATDNYVI